MKRTINLANALERVVLREIIVIDSSGKAVRTTRTSLRL
jgi:hypothetical protein